MQLRFDEDPMYLHAARKLIYFVAGIMPVACSSPVFVFVMADLVRTHLSL